MSHSKQPIREESCQNREQRAPVSCSMHRHRPAKAPGRAGHGISGVTRHSP